jgi:hypothetical protein
MNIYQLDHDWQQIQDQLEELDGSDLTPELEEQIISLLAKSDTLSNEWQNKLDGYCKLIAMLSYQAETRRSEALRLTKLTRSDDNKVDRLKEIVKDSLLLRGQTKVKTKLFNLSICKNGGKAPLILPDNVDVLPPEFVQTFREPMKDEIRTALENGDTIEGCYLGEKGDHLRIK